MAERLVFDSYHRRTKCTTFELVDARLPLLHLSTPFQLFILHIRQDAADGVDIIAPSSITCFMASPLVAVDHEGSIAGRIMPSGYTRRPCTIIYEKAVVACTLL